jgi:Protein of unknown function (DUF2905)
LASLGRGSRGSGLGRLPGDIVIERDNFSFYAPIATGLIVSVVLSLILWLLNRLRGKRRGRI